MRKYIQIVETITNDLGLNKRIEDKIDEVSPGSSHELLDGLEILYRAGPRGKSAREWMADMRTIYPDLTSEQAATVMKNLLKNFSFCVSHQDKNYTWKASPMADDDSIDPDIAAAASTQIAMTHRIIELVRELGTFTDRDLLPHLAVMGLPPQMCRIFLDHVLSGMMGKSITKHGETYTYSEEKPKTVADHMRSFRDMLG